MSRIDELVERLCPDGVEYKPLGVIAELKRGQSITRKNISSGSIPVVAGGREIAYFCGDSNREGETIVIAGSGAYAGYVSWWSRPIFVSDSFSIKVSEELVSMRFCYYWLTSQQEILYRLKRGGGVPHVYPRDVSPLMMPVPPLEVQMEIVRILDLFTSLEAELEAELEARKGQLEYYSELLVSGVSIGSLVRLGEVASIARGASPRPIRSFVTESDDGVPWIRIGDVPPDGKYISGTSQKIIKAGAEKSRVVRPGDFVLSNSMSFGRPYIVDVEGCVHDGWLVISNFEAHFIPEFLYYALRSRSVQGQFEQRAGSGTVRNLNSEIVREVVLPCPALGLQRKIADTLGKFADLSNSLSIGLPAEIAARRQQYEYYRDRLLAFKEKAS